jgi:hypothetical protein
MRVLTQYGPELSHCTDWTGVQAYILEIHHPSAHRSGGISGITANGKKGENFKENEERGKN